jgi:protein-disulfide isomerase
MLKPLTALTLLALLPLAASQAAAQTAVPPNPGEHFQDTSMLKPPAGARVALYEFEDLECPPCSHAYPIVHAAMDHYKIPLVRRDYPLNQIHPWAFDAAVTARYLRDRVSPTVEESFRHDVFASQDRISSRDDLAAFTLAWFHAHHQPLPFVIDPDGSCKKEVQADHALGDRIGRLATPCVFVVTADRWVHVVDMSQLYRVIDQALLATTPHAPPAKRRTP